MSKLLSLVAWAQTQQDGVTFIDIAPPEPEHNIVWVILSTFALIGVALLVTVAIGTGMGFLRIWIYKVFPGNKLNGPEYEPMTRLHLLDRGGTDKPTS
jgi:hypothetical protein